jgi:hypothetical protein
LWALRCGQTYRRSQHRRLLSKDTPANETKVFDHQALQKAAAKLKALDVSQIAAVHLNGKMQGPAGLIEEFDERWKARSTTHAEAA